MACRGKYVGVRCNVCVQVPARVHSKTSPRRWTPFLTRSRRWGMAEAICAAGSDSTSTLKDSKPEAEPKMDSSTVKSTNSKAEDTANAGEKAPTEVNANATSAKPTPPKPKVLAAKKAPNKPLPEMMTADIIPAVKAILEKETDVSKIELSFQENKLEGSFAKQEIPYCFWVFFLDGTLEGLKAFSVSSYGAPPSTFEPFLTIERKPTAPLVVFGIQKRLSAQRILPEVPVQSK